MATKSFDEKVVISDPKKIKEIKEELKNSTSSYKPCTNKHFSIDSANKNAKKWNF